MHSFEVSLGYESVDRTTFSAYRASLKALIELHFQHEALPRFTENVLQSTLSYPNETSKQCIQFLSKSDYPSRSYCPFFFIFFLNLKMFV